MLATCAVPVWLSQFVPGLGEEQPARGVDRLKLGAVPFQFGRQHAIGTDQLAHPEQRCGQSNARQQRGKRDHLPAHAVEIGAGHGNLARLAIGNPAHRCGQSGALCRRRRHRLEGSCTPDFIPLRGAFVGGQPVLFAGDQRAIGRKAKQRHRPAPEGTSGLGRNIRIEARFSHSTASLPAITQFIHPKVGARRSCCL